MKKLAGLALFLVLFSVFSAIAPGGSPQAFAKAAPAMSDLLVATPAPDEPTKCSQVACDPTFVDPEHPNDRRGDTTCELSRVEGERGGWGCGLCGAGGFCTGGAR